MGKKSAQLKISTNLHKSECQFNRFIIIKQPRRDMKREIEALSLSFATQIFLKYMYGFQHTFPVYVRRMHTHTHTYTQAIQTTGKYSRWYI